MDKKNLSPRDLVRRYKGGILIAFEVLVLAVMINVFFVPKIQDIFALTEEIELKTEENNETAAYLSYLRTLAGVTLDLEEEVVHYALPSENDIISLIVTYEGLSTRSGVDLSPLELTPGLISTPTAEEAAAVETLLSSKGIRPTIRNKLGNLTAGVQTLTFEASATVVNADVATSFIRDIYNTRRLFDIKRLAWKTNIDGSVTLTMTLATYYYPEFSIRPSEQLVRQGQLQEEFIDRLKNTLVYDQFVLDNVSVGKDDLFRYGPGAASLEPPTPPAEIQESGDTI